VFQILTSDEGLVETIPTVDELAQARLREILAADEKPDPASLKRGSLSQLLEETEPSPPARAVVPAPLAEKKVELDGKPLPFHQSRMFMTAILLTIVAMAGYGFISWYVAQVNALTTAAGVAEAKLTAKVRRAAAPNAASSKKKPPPPPAMIGAPVGPGAVALTAPVEEGRAIAPATARVGDLVVGVSGARLGPLNRSVPENCLSLSLRITNLGEKPVAYSGWSDSRVRVVLRDHSGNYYNKVATGLDERLIQPGVTITDTLSFEPTPLWAQLDLDLPVIGSEKPFRFRITGTFIERPPMFPAQPPARVAGAQGRTPPAPTAYDPEADPEVRRAILSEYRDGMRKIQRRVLGMSTNRADEARRTEPVNLVKSIAKKHNLEGSQVRRILGDE
jgi:hypothetical protein